VVGHPEVVQIRDFWPWNRLVGDWTGWSAIRWLIGTNHHPQSGRPAGWTLHVRKDRWWKAVNFPRAIGRLGRLQECDQSPLAVRYKPNSEFLGPDRSLAKFEGSAVS